ncbi:unnamed protein product [Mytilus edulis]|uniref:Uncharacterized protein n=1 Tax=Mytilus edulis TaxID=6550 RepID=A0A8S3SD59_MYTED|nr:unnamed protein product [Mytilus edulis]
MPSKKITPQASDVTKLAFFDGQMYHDEVPVESSPPFEVFTSLIAFLSKFPSKPTLYLYSRMCDDDIQLRADEQELQQFHHLVIRPVTSIFNPLSQYCQDLDVLKVHALLEEESRGTYKVNYIITEVGRIVELQYDNKVSINLGDYKLLKKFRVHDEKLSLPSHALVSI